MAVQLLSITSLVGTGILAGVLVAVAVSVLPALFALPASRYVETHQLLGKGYHPTMPLITAVALVCDLALAAIAPSGPSRVLYLGAAVLLFGVGLVSQFRNVPLNRAVNRLRPDALPDDWEDPRPPWRSWHMVRTWFSLCALVLTSAAAVLLP